MTRLRWLLLLALLGLGPLPGGPAAWPPGTARADTDDRDDDDGDDDADDDDDDDAPARPAAPPAARPPIPASSGLSTVGRSLRVGRLWSERGGALPVLRLGLERGGVLVGALTLHPATLEPLPHAQRGLAQAGRAPGSAALERALHRLSAQSGTRLSTGSHATASARGPQLPVYWSGRLVGYLTLDLRGQPLADAAAQRGWAASALRVRR